MGTELTEINLAGWLQLPPEEQRETLTSLHKTIDKLTELKKAVHAAVVEQGLEVPGFQIIKDRTKTEFALDERDTAIEIHVIAGQLGIDERAFLRPKSPAELKKLMGSAVGQRLFIETTGKETVRIKGKE